MAFGKLSPKQPRVFEPNIGQSSKWTGQGILRTPGGRLTLTSGTPVTTSDVTGASAATVYYTPYKNNLVPLYDGVQWRDVVFTEKSIALPATTSTMYDVWGYYDAPNNALALELLAWSSGTARATNLGTQDGTNVKSGDPTRLYLGSVYTGTSSGQSEDSNTKRYLWNMYNRKLRRLGVFPSTSSWTYTTKTWRQANATTSNQVEAVCGLSEDTIDINVLISVANSNASQVPVWVGVGVDSTTTNSAIIFNEGEAYTVQYNIVTAVYQAFPTAGYHKYVWLEMSTATGTTTWYCAKDAGGTNTIASGIWGQVLG